MGFKFEQVRFHNGFTFSIVIALEEFVKVVTLSLSSVVEGIAAIIIAHATIRCVFVYAVSALAAARKIDNLTIRLQLGKTLALALEFLLAADVLRSAVAPNWDDIGKLAAIAALRTILNYFLEQELKHTSARKKLTS